MAKDKKNPIAKAVGYGKPPVEHQFKKGSSGNPKGRPKGSKNLKTDLIEELQEMILVREGNGRRRRISKQRALLKTIMAKGLNGDAKAYAAALNLALKVTDPAAPAPGAASTSDQDRKLIEQFLARHAGAVSNKEIDHE
jgi:hypothetical protein